MRCAARADRSGVIVEDLKLYLGARLRQVSATSKQAQAIRHALTRFLSDGHIEISMNTVERPTLPIALNLMNALFAGSGDGGDDWALSAMLIEDCKLSRVNPHDWLTRTLIALANGHSAHSLVELRPSTTGA